MEYKLKSHSGGHHLITRSGRALALVMLLVNGAGALYGGTSLMIDPSGTQLGLPPDWIARLPFNDYFIPGLILFAANGVLSFAAAIATISRSRGYEKFITAQGCVLTGWIFVQVLLLRTTVFLHFAMAGIGLTLIALGVILSINRTSDGRE